jgi:peptidoglycan/LPS O-acetylase OafA/YrhL
MKPLTPKYRPHIDGLRAIAVLAVIVFHAFPAALPGGYVGVDIFFVISGFLISTILYSEFGAPESGGVAIIGNFYARRIRRIFPALAVVLTACLIAGYYLLFSNEYAKLGFHVLASAGFYQNLLLSRETGYFNSDPASNPLLHLWSLGVEEQFYLFWPLIIWLLVRCRIKLLPAAVFIAAFSFWWRMETRQADAAAAFFLPQMRLWELLIGAIAASLFPEIGKPHRAESAGGSARGGAWRTFLSNSVPVLGLVAIAAGFRMLSGKSDVPFGWMLLPTMGAAFLVCSDGSAWINRRVISNPVLVWIGLISYPLYLWHWPLLSFSQLSSDEPDSLEIKLAAVACAVVLAWLTYWLIENPVRRMRSAGIQVAGLASAMTIVACLGLLVFRQGGFPARFPRIIQELANFGYDNLTPWRSGRYFIDVYRGQPDFKPDPNEIAPGRPVLFLWGDSHAAALYPGVQKVYGDRYSVVQRTVVSIPPLLPSQFHDQTAIDINQEIMDSIRRIHPDVVMLQGHWAAWSLPGVEPTVVALKALGIPHIVVVGPVPEWFISLPQQLSNYARRHPSAAVPTRLASGFRPEPMELDAQMADMCRRQGVTYFSPCKIFRNSDGFLIRTGDTADTLTAYDYGHLTVAGATYLASRFPAF